MGTEPAQQVEVQTSDGCYVTVQKKFVTILSFEKSWSIYLS